MKRSQLKALVKECVREIILEEGLLKTIVTEVAEGLNAGLVVESRQAPVPNHEQDFRKQMNHSRKKVLGAIGKSGYEDAKENLITPLYLKGQSHYPAVTVQLVLTPQVRELESRASQECLTGVIS